MERFSYCHSTYMELKHRSKVIQHSASGKARKNAKSKLYLSLDFTV